MLILKNDQGNISCGNLVCSTLEWGYLPPKTEVLDGWLFYSESFGESNKRPCLYLVITYIRVLVQTNLGQDGI